MPKKKRTYGWYLAPILLLSAVAVWWFLTQNRQQKDPLQSLRITTVKRRDISSKVLATGIIKPKVGAEVKVGSRVSGVVKRLCVGIGDEVVKGQLLAEIDPIEYRAQYRQAEAELQNAGASLLIAQADLKSAQADFQFMKVSKERAESLLEFDIVPRMEYDEVEAKYLQAEARIEQQRARIKQQQAQVEQREAQLEFARIQLGHTQLYAPIDGVVASVSTQEGETVAASFAAPTFVTILDLDHLEIWTYIDETDIGRIEPGQEASFTVDTYTETTFDGKVKTIYPQAELKDNVVNYLAIVEIGDRQGKVLRPEMTATVSVQLETKANVLAVPNRAIQREPDGKIVQVVLGEKIEYRPVQTGVRDKYYTEITNGLSVDERIVTNPPSQ